MSNKTDKHGKVPKLRFSEFRDAGQWDEKKAGALFASRTEEGETGLPIYSVTINDGMIKRSLLDRHFDDIAEPEGNKKAYKDEIAYNMMRMWQGAFGVVVEDCMVSPAYVVLAPRDGVCSDFFGYLLKLPRYLRLLTSHSQGLTSDRLRLYYKYFAEIPLSYPALTEQKRIADCLSSIDALIAAQAQEVEALKAHKKGLMQQLFPAEGETVPKLRFPEFKDASDWIPSSLGEIARIASGGTPSRSNGVYWSGRIPWVTTSLIDFNIILEAHEFISDIGLEESAAKVFPENTIIMAMYGQGKTRGKVAILGIRAATNQACAAILIKEKIDTFFLFQNLAGRYDEIRKISNAGGQENLSAALIDSIPFQYPDPETNEQRKIGDCLSSLDDLIFAQTQKIESLKTHKKGLMQQLFPSADEAHG